MQETVTWLNQTEKTQTYFDRACTKRTVMSK